MSGLDIDSLRLTEDEGHNIAGGRVIVPPREVADAQLAKALLGFREWLEGGWETGDDLSHQLRDALEQANIKRPS